MSTTTLGATTPRRSSLVLATLFLGTFVLGTAELLVVGVLDLIARDTGVSIGTTGGLVSAYAVGIAIGGPILTAATIRFSRRSLLRLSLAAYLPANLLLAFATDFELMLLARVVTGSLQGLFIGVAFAIGVSVVPVARMGRAISAVIGGIAVSTALGVPIGTLIGQELGWRGAFLAIVGLGAIALAASVAIIPEVGNTGTDGFRAQGRHAFAPPVLAVLAVGFLLMGGQYAALTYITPFLQNVTGISGGLISGFLLAYGAATAVGVFVGGWAADRGASRTLLIANVLLLVSLGGLFLVGSSPVLTALVLIGWGVVGFGLVPSLQHRVVSLAGPGRDLAATLPASAVNGGIAAGAVIGGWAVAGQGPSAPSLVGLGVILLALPVTFATSRLSAVPDRHDIDVGLYAEAA